eukprot:TRINITY_DN2833_c0_g1_i1.p1 TRINITY_DN2833_c0_g1~~TRINITY_DN2833_c0_g1_i1.p1  ORF type:complete len:650 (-),score=101.94 TRINITY_DN2833_c0_g1_i1:73-2022(-)
MGSRSNSSSTMGESSRGHLSSIKDIDLWDLNRLDPSVAEVNIIAVRLLVVSSKGANPDGNVPTRASSPPSSPNHPRHTHYQSATDSAVGAGAGRGGQLTNVGAIQPLSLTEINTLSGSTIVPSHKLSSVAVQDTTTMAEALSDVEVRDCFSALLVGKIGSRSDVADKKNTRGGIYGHNSGECFGDEDGHFDDETICTAIGSLPPKIQVQFELQLLRQLDDLRMIKTTTTPAIGASHLSTHPLLPPTTCSSLLPSKVVGAGLEYYDALHRLKVEQLVHTRAALLTYLEEFVEESNTMEHDGACRESDLDSNLDGDCRSGSYDSAGESTSLIVPRDGGGNGGSSLYDRTRAVQRRAALSLHQAIMGQMTAEQIAEGGHNIFMAIQQQQLEDHTQSVDDDGDDNNNASMASGVMSSSTTHLMSGVGSPTSIPGGGKHYHSTRRSIADSLTGEQKRKSLRLLLRNDEAVNQETAPPSPAGRTASHHHHHRHASISNTTNTPHRLSIHNFTSPTTLSSRSQHPPTSSISSSQWPSFAQQSSSAPLLAAEARKRTVLHKEGDTDGVFSNPFGTSQGLAELLLVHTQLNPYAVDIGDSGVGGVSSSPPSSSTPTTPRTTVSYTHLRAHETPEHLVCRLLLEKKKKRTNKSTTSRVE